jgi:hypothetical protein
MRARLGWARWCMGIKSMPCIREKGEKKEKEKGGLTPGHVQEKREREG